MTEMNDRVVMPYRQPTGDLWELFRAQSHMSKWHNYFAVYERELDPWRECQPKVLEIGVRHGGSLALWRDYFGEGATIVGVDIDPACAQYDRGDEGIHVHIGDQGDREFMRNVATMMGPFDIVIDDGSHMTSHQIATLATVYPTMAENGVYIIEDVHSNVWDNFVNTESTLLDISKQMIDEAYEPYAPRDKSMVTFGDFAVGGAVQRDGVVTSWFAANTFAIRHYDSMVVFERGLRSAPVNEDKDLVVLTVIEGGAGHVAKKSDLVDYMPKPPAVPKGGEHNEQGQPGE